MSFADKRARVRVLVIISVILIALCLLLIIPVAGRMSQNKLLRILTSFWNIGLFRAASSGDSNALRKLLDGGSDPNTRDHNGEPVIAHAAKAGHAEVVRILISYGAEVNAEFDNDRRTSLGLAAYRGYPDVVKVLLEHGANPEKGAPGGSGTPLMLAASGGYIEIVKLLLKAGAKVNATNRFDKTAKDCALASLKNPNVVDLLLQEAKEKKARFAGKWPTSEEDVRAALTEIISLLSQAEKSQ